jgi:hypothetical protein
MKLSSQDHRSRPSRHRMPLALRVPEPMLEEIDGIAASRPDRPDRSSLVRELLAEGLAAHRKRAMAIAGQRG